MYTHLITFFAVILLFELCSTGGSGFEIGWGEFVAGVGATLTLFYLLGRLIFSKWERRVTSAGLRKEMLPILHASLVQRLAVVAVGVYAIILYVYQWKTVCLVLLGKNAPQVLISFLGILPFLVSLLAIWAASFPTRRLYSSSELSLRSHLASQSKLHLIILAPWFTILLLSDIIAWIAPLTARRIQEDPLWSLGAFAVFILLLIWLFPYLIVKVWRCPSLPSGPQRKTLEAFFAQNKFRYADIILWTLFEGSVATAGIFGFFPGARYILITPSLLRTLEVEELKAVMAHEMGHARHHHMLFYLFFIIGLTLVFQISSEVVSWGLGLSVMAFPSWEALLGVWRSQSETASIVNSLIRTVPALLLVILYFRFGFGLFSRNFERQSDLHALRTQGSSGPLVRAFEKISGFNPLLRLLPNWHHFSIQERIDFLLDCETQPRLIEHHHRKVRLMVGGYLIFFMLMSALLVAWGTQEWRDRWALAMGQRLVEQQLARSPQDAKLWFALGIIAFEREDLGNAEAAYRKSIQLDPNNPETINNLAWLYATAPETEFRDPIQALRLARQAVALRPEAPHILDTLAEALFVNGRPQEALETELKALRHAEDREGFYKAQILRFRRALRN